MPRKVKLFAAGLLLAVVGVCCAFLFSASAHAEDEDWLNGGPHPPISGNGWAIDQDGIMTVESNAGWQDFLANGPGEWIWEHEDAVVIERVQKLIIGKNVTALSIYDPTRINEGPMEDVAISFCYNAGIYKPYVSVMLQNPKCMPPEIEVEEGNRVFSVENGLLINRVKKSVVLSEVDITDVVIPDGIQEIEAWAFYYRDITSVVFPKSLKTIGAAAFSNCNYLTEVGLPNTLTRMDTCAFADCESLKRVTISSGLKTIEAIAFQGCPLEKITIPEGIQAIGFMAFEGCDALVQVTLPETLTKIDNYAFSTCKRLKQMNLPSHLSYVGYRAFENCDSWKFIQLPNSLATIGEEAFLGCAPILVQLPQKLTVKAVPPDQRGWSMDIKEEDPSTRQLGFVSVETLIVSGTKYSMGNYLVNQTGQVIFLQKPTADWKKIALEISSNTIYYLDQNAASWQALDQSILGGVCLVPIAQTKIHEIVEKARDSADSFRLPQGSDEPAVVTPSPDFESSGWSMYNNKTLEIRSNDGWLNWLRQNEHVNPSKLIIGRNVTNLTLYDMSETVPVTGFYQTKDIIGYAENGSAIYSYAESSFINPTKIVLDEHNQSFSFQNGMLIDLNKNEVVLTDSTLPSSVVIQEGIRSIGNGAFRGRSISQILLPSSLEQIGAAAFENCTLSSIQLPQSVTTIGKIAFQQCQKLRSVTLPDSLTEVGIDAFFGCRLSLLCIPPELHMREFDEGSNEFAIEANSNTTQNLGLESVDTVIFSGSDYDFGYPAISHAHNVYFLGKPPEDVGQILDENSVESIFCSDEFEFEWTRSTVASWVRQRLTILPAEQLKQITDQEINATPLPTDMPRPTPRPTETPWPTPKPRPTASPAVTAKPQQQGTDPLVFAFAGMLALIIAGIVVVVVKSWDRKRKKKRKKYKKVSL